MSSFEFSLHFADFQRDPWNQERGDMRAAMIAATLCNTAGMQRKRNSPPARVEDFMLYREREFHEPDSSEIIAFMKGEG